MILALALALPALACPTVATGTTDALSFDVAQVAIVRQGTHTTFSVSINPSGTPQSFALVQPVPEVLAEDQIRTLDATLFPTLDGFTAPRHVADAGCGGGVDNATDGGAGDGGASGGTGGVDVEAEYLVGEYAVTILSATESAALSTWLDEHGFFLPDGADAMLEAYIEGGSYFLAARVADEAAVADGTPLSPLQIAYDSEVFAIPIRLATLNSPGAQDMVIYAATDLSDGSVGIANYPEFAVPDRCIWGHPSTDDFGRFYTDLFRSTWADQGDAAWTEEFEGTTTSPNPAGTVVLRPEDLEALGFVGGLDQVYLTRLRMRYTPAQADQDLVLYTSGLADPEVTAYADDVPVNHECVETYCDGTPTGAGGDGGASADGGGEDDDADEKGCAQGAGPASGLGALLALLAAGRRRRLG